jgi:hopanoid biosynthesis associated RND transporter like protein HpnN
MDGLRIGPPEHGKLDAVIGERVGRSIAVVTKLCSQRPWLTVGLSTLLACCALLYTWYGLAFVTSPYRLLPQEAPYVVVLQKHLREFGELNDIIVVVASPEPETAKAYAVRLGNELTRAGVRRFSYRLETASLQQNALLYLPRDDLRTLRDRLFDYEDLLRVYAARPTLVRLLESLNQQLANAIALGFLDLGLERTGAGDLRFIDAILGEAMARFDGQAGRGSPWSLALSGSGFRHEDAGWFFSADRRLLFVFVKANSVEGDFTDNRERIELIRSTIARLRPQFPGVDAGVTGSSAISNDEMTTAFADSARAGILSSLLTLGLILVAFRRVVKPMLMLATLTIGLAWSMGVITLVVGRLNIFSVMFVSIVVGLAIDYGIYLLYGYEEALGRGASRDRALWIAARQTGAGILVAALTAAGTFFVLRLTDFSGIGEFGVVSGIAILASFVSMITLFPALLVLVDRRRPRLPTGVPRTVRAAGATWLARMTARPMPVLATAAALTVLAGWGALHVGFDDNLLRLQARGTESVLWEERTLATVGRSGVTAITTAATPTELERKHEALARLPSVAKVESLLTLVPNDQAEKIAIIEQLAPMVAPVRMGTPDPLRPRNLQKPLEVLQRRLEIVLGGLDESPSRREVEQTRAKVQALLRRLVEVDSAATRLALNQLQSEMFRDFADRLSTFQQSLAPRTVTVADIPESLRERFIGASGQYLIRIFPAVDIWEREGATRFVGDLRTVDPDVTGPPVTSFEAIRFIRRGYWQGALYAFVLVAVLTGALLRSATGTLLALTPLALGMMWTLGLMRLLGLEFNLANVWAVPLIIGAAVEYGVNTYMRSMDEGQTEGPMLPRSAVLAVMLNGLTTITGFGSLMIAHHRGMWSLGLLLTLGTAVSLVAALGVLPSLMRLFAGGRRPGRGNASQTAIQVTH